MTDFEGIEDGVAIIGMSGRFPGAKNIKELWDNLCEGRDCLTRFSLDEISSLVDKDVLESPDYVPVRGVLAERDLFDAEFFGMSAREAQMMDPQQRIFLECAWHAFEDAGYVGGDVDGLVGVFGGMGNSTYFLNNLKSNPELVEKFGEFQTMLSNEKDFLATRIAHKLDLKGPSLSINTGCSTSLVAVSEAYNSLLNYQTDMALAGGVSVQFPDQCGYLYIDGSIASKTGKCSTFDAEADGTVFGNGAGIVVMKRLEDAIADRDRIYAVIRGVGVNNDGAKKLSYTAPSVDGQSAAILMAQTAAEVEAESISYIEAHGTATPVGDPIEVEALTQAFSSGTDKKQFCGIGSIKSNIGHLDTAAGIAGLIKSVLILQHKKIPPTIHYKSPNPAIDFTDTPFYVTDQTVDLSSDSPLRVGVSSFGVGGTNAHVILEEAPKISVDSTQRPYHVLLWSAKHESGVKTLRQSLQAHLQDSKDDSLADIAYTLQLGRQRFGFRQFAVCRTKEEALNVFSKPERLGVQNSEKQNTSVVYMFPGQGSQYVNMAKAFYLQESVFSETFDKCCSVLDEILDHELRGLIYPSSEENESHSEVLNQTAITQPALFVIEYSLAKLWQSWGVAPAAMIGHSVGEYVAACLAGVFSLEDALKIIAKRGALIQSLPPGLMLAVRESEGFVSEFLNAELTAEDAEKLSIAVVNTLDACVVAGDQEVIERLNGSLKSKNVKSIALKTSHAFHSHMMDPILPEFEAYVAQFSLSAPKIKFISSVTGDWISDENATDPAYWAKHIRCAVQFAKGRQQIFQDYSDAILLEVGPGNTLTNIARNKGFSADTQNVVSSVGNANDNEDEDLNLMSALGALWSAGVDIDWSSFYEGQNRSRVGLPSYPFQRKSHWVDARASAPVERSGASITNEDISNTGISVENAIETEASKGTPVEAVDRKTHLVGELKKLLSDLSGMEESELYTDVTFIKLGFDSLFLTQVNTAFKKAFKIEISFRQLLESTATIDDMAKFLDDNLDDSEFQPSDTSPNANAQLPLREAVSNSSATSEISSSNEKEIAVANTISLEARRLMDQELRADTAGDEQRHGPWKQINKKIQGELKQSHREGLNKLITDYTKKTGKSKELIQLHRPHFADPRTISGFNSTWKEIIYPIVTDRSKGSRMWDIDGNEYIDVQSGFGSVLFGQNPDFIREALVKQLESGPQVGPQSKFAGEVAEKVCEITGMDRVTFCNTGSEAVLAAMRVSRTVTGNNKIVIFNGDYHGIFDDVVARSANGNNKILTLPAAPGIPKESLSNTVVLEFGDPSSFDVINSIGGDIAAILVEPVQSRKPSLQPKEFLKQLRAWTEEHSVPLIFDEVITGMRIHPRGAQGWYGIDADMVTYGKIIGGGMPAGLLAGRKQYMDALDGGMWQYGDESVPEVGVTFFAGTFVRHPLMIAAANAVVEELKRGGEKLYTDLNSKADRMAASLNSYYESKGVPLYIQNCGSMMVIEFLAKLEYNPLFFYRLRLEGIFLLDAGSFFLNLSHTDDDIDKLIAGFKAATEFMLEYDFFPTIKQVSEFPLTKPQQEIWMATQFQEDASSAYNLSNTLRFEGLLDLGRLNSALLKLVNTNDALRITITQNGIAKIGEELKSLELEVEDFSQLDERKRSQRMEQAASLDVEKPFDLEQGPLYRLNLFKLSEQEHILFVCVHHVVCDGWSCEVLTHRLEELYNEAPADSMAPVAMQYSQYASWLEAPEQIQRAEADQQYWLNLHKNLAPELELPEDRSRPPIKTFVADNVSLQLETGLIDRIGEFSRKNGVTQFSFLLSAFEALIYRISSQAQFNIGVPAAGHMLVGDHKLIGHCVNFLPLKVAIEEEKSFSTLLKNTQDHVFEAFEHQLFTYGELINELGVVRDASRNPLISIVFNVDKIDTSVNFDNLKVEIGTNKRHFEIFELFLNVVLDGSDMCLEASFNADLFDRSTVEHWMKLYHVLIKSILEEDDKDIKSISILSSEEKDTIFNEWNATECEIKKDANLLSLISEQAKISANKIAINCDGEKLTFKELEENSNKFANYLQHKGVKPGNLIGLCIDRSNDMVTALLGILKSGCAYVPLDPEYPSDRLHYMVEDSQMTHLVLLEKYSKLFDDQLEFVVLDQVQGEIELQSPNYDGVKIDNNSPAYIIYTSGSTGKPKGVIVQHEAVTNFLLSMAEKPGLNADDKLLAITTLSFDIAVLELYLPLIVGATCVIATAEQAVDGMKLLDLIKSEQITFLQATPTRWRMLIAAGWDANNPLKALTGGEALQQDLSQEIFSNCTELWNMYGPTETTVWSTVYQITDGEAKVLIGKPIQNTEIYILDSNLQAVPIGVSGELYIGGLGVTQGYLNREELTAERFIKHPLSEGKLYRTGDKVRYLADGNIEYLGRLDSQVKLRGFRIELGEIETSMRKHPNIKDCALTIREPAPGDFRLIAFVVWEGNAITLTELRKFLRQWMPSHMIPQSIEDIDELPRTPNGKLDRKSLPDVFSSVSEASSYVEPNTETSICLAKLWAETIRIPKVGLTDNFFDLGGHSILSMQVIHKVKEQYDVFLSPRDLLMESLEQHAAKIDASKQQGQVAVAAESETAAPKKKKGLISKLFG
ncbi:hypothetical protein NBRC116493_14470 [Aurantivibrio infirmus]